MKKILSMFLFALAGAAILHAEVIDSVMFNPSRFGRYEHLKVSKELDSAGKVEVKNMTIQSSGTVTIVNNGNYEIETINIEPKNGIALVDMRRTKLGPTNMEVRGGKAAFEGENDSIFRSFTSLNSSENLSSSAGEAISAIKIKVGESNGGANNGVLFAPNAVLHIGVPGKFGESQLKEGYNGKVRGLTLGNNYIPPDPKRTGCSLAWIERKAEKTSGQDSAKTYQVLTMTGCKEVTEEQDCSSNPHQQKCCTATNQIWDGATCNELYWLSCADYNEDVLSRLKDECFAIGSVVSCSALPSCVKNIWGQTKNIMCGCVGDNFGNMTCSLHSNPDLNESDIYECEDLGGQEAVSVTLDYTCTAQSGAELCS